MLFSTQFTKFYKFFWDKKYKHRDKKAVRANGNWFQIDEVVLCVDPFLSSFFQGSSCVTAIFNDLEFRFIICGCSTFAAIELGGGVPTINPICSRHQSPADYLLGCGFSMLQSRNLFKLFFRRYGVSLKCHSTV